MTRVRSSTSSHSSGMPSLRITRYACIAVACPALFPGGVPSACVVTSIAKVETNAARPATRLLLPLRLLVLPLLY